MRKCCIPLYNDVQDLEGNLEEDENGNTWVRKATIPGWDDYTMGET